LNTQLGPDLRKFGIYCSRSPLFYCVWNSRYEQRSAIKACCWYFWSEL